MSENDTNQKIQTQGQFDYKPTNTAVYEKTHHVSFSTNVNGVYPVQSPFGVDSEIFILFYACTDAGAKCHLAADINTNNSLNTFQPMGVMGIYLMGVQSIALPETWVPVKDAVYASINGLTTGNIQLIAIWRMRSDMVLPSEEKLKRFSEPTF